MNLPHMLFPQDSAGRTALHVSILCKHPRCSHLLLAHPSLDLAVRDKNGNTAFAAALASRDNEVGKAILQRDPNAAEQVQCVRVVQCTCTCIYVFTMVMCTYTYMDIP